MPVKPRSVFGFGIGISDRSDRLLVLLVLPFRLTQLGVFSARISFDRCFSGSPMSFVLLQPPETSAISMPRKTAPKIHLFGRLM
jgi:hypothetical protein